jgi:Heterokaryon incompatibility protein (HET)
MTNVPKYSYSPIEASEIRLLKFLGIDKDGISGTLQKFSIAKYPPPYTALSYVWSSDGTSSSKSRRMLIDGGQLHVLDSLQPFFEVLQTKETLVDDSWWWIDSICVNQEDDLEKNSQVELMNSIYSRAASTTVWLGNGSSDSDKAMDFIASIRKLRQEVHIKAIEKELKLEQYSSHWKALENLLVRRWWTRVWTMQEFILSRYLSFWCGLKTVSRMAVADTLWFFYLCRPNELHACTAFINGWHRRRVSEWYQRSSNPESAPYFRMSLVALASYCSNNNATNDKDLLYGLCGLTPDIQLIEIDYRETVTVEEVYINFTKAHIKHYESLDIICFSDLYGTSVESSLPSWVPDWRKRLPQNFVVPLMVSQSSNQRIGNFRPPQYVRRDKPSATYTASGNTKPSLRFEGLDLVVRGFVLDAIDGLSASANSTLVQPSRLVQMPTEDNVKSSEWALDYLNRISGCLILGRRDRYLQNPVIPKSFVADFWKFCSNVMQNNDSEVPTAFKIWFNRNRPLSIRGYPLESLIQYAALDRRWRLESENSISVTDLQSLNSFTGRFYDTIVRMTRRLMVSKDGLLGIAPDQSQKGDMICILFGCSVPVVLRKTADGTKFEFIGECFVDGYMSGEAVLDNRFEERDFCIA